jgi:NAD(P)-dependent dehydrogenase (short-subunit alcohol dehydrogenase family)
MLKEKTIVVTGATGGLGKALVSRLAGMGADVVALGRNEARLQEVRRSVNQGVRTDTIDLGDRDSVRAAADRLLATVPRIDALVHTAAVYRNERRIHDGLEEMFGTNHLGPFHLTARLKPALQAGKARVVFVSAPSSTKLDFDDLQGEKKKFSALTAFGASKAANLLCTFELARRWKGTGITIDAFHPGLIKTSLMTESPWLLRTMLNLVSRDPERAVDALVAVIDQPGVDGEGRFFKLEKPSTPPGPSQDRDAQKRLWEVSEQLVG